MTDRRAGGVGVNVDLTVTPARRVGAVGVMVDYVPGAGGPTLVTVSTTQAQAVGLAGSASVVRTATLAQTATLRRASQLTRALILGTTATSSLTIGARSIVVTASVATAVMLARAITLRRAVTVTLQAVLRRQTSLTRTVTQAQSVAGAFGRGFLRTVTAVQGQAVSLRKTLQLRRALTGSHRIQTRVALAGSPNRLLRITRPTTVRLVRQIRLTRAVTQGQSVTLGGIPVQLLLLSTVQTRSLALGRVISLIRGIVQGTAAILPRGSSIERTIVQPTLLARTQAADLTRSISQAQLVSLEVLDVTPFYEIVVSTTVGQQVALSQTGTGASAKHFVVAGRDANFVVGPRRADFAVARRGVRFTVEVR